VREAAIFQTEAEFREWFEKNLGRFGVKRVILSQEVCPDYVLEMDNGQVLRVEAELFAINFRYHKHDPAKVDLILACYAKAPDLDGVPVVTANKLWCEEIEPLELLPAEGPLSEIEEVILTIVHGTGGIDISAIAARSTYGSLSGEHEIFMRLPPDTVKAVPRGRIDDSILNVVSPEAKQFMKKYHHVLIGAGLSVEACTALSTLRGRGLVSYRPMEIAAALYDGVLIRHPGWVPTEVQSTKRAWELHRGTILRGMFPRRDAESDPTEE